MGNASLFSLAAIRKVAAGPIARGSILSLVIKLAGMGLAFIQGILAARILGADGYGYIAFAMSVIQIFSVIALFGFGDLAIREIPRLNSAGARSELLGFLRAAACVTATFSLFLGVAFVLLGSNLGIFQYLAQSSIILITLLAVLFTGTRLMRSVAQGFGAVVLAQIPGEVLRPFVVVSVLIGAIWIGLVWNIDRFLTLYLAASLAAFLTAVGACLLLLRNILPATQSGHAESRSNITDALPLFGLSVLVILQSELATVMLALFASPEQTGLYQPVARLTPIIALPASAVAMRYAPRISEFWNSDQASRLVAVTRTYTLVTAGLTALVAIVIAGLGPWILLAFGPEFVASAPLLWIVGAAQIFNTSCGPVGNLLVMTGQTRAATTTKLAGLLCAVAAALMLVPSHGAMGAALAVAAGLVAWNVTALIAVRKILGFDPSILQFLSRTKSSIDTSR